jgi:hypothetical protein
MQHKPSLDANGHDDYCGIYDWSVLLDHYTDVHRLFSFPVIKKQPWDPDMAGTQKMEEEREVTYIES